LPPEVRDYVWHRLWSALTDETVSAKFDRLSKIDRMAIVEIIRDTVPDLPEYWKER